MRQYGLVIVLLAAGFTYAVVRYVLCGPVSPEQLPLFLVNKALAVGSLLLLALSLVTGPLLRRPDLPADHPLHPRLLGTAGLVAAGLHVVGSALLLDPYYFPAFYRPDGRLTWRAEAAMLAGLAGLALLWWQASASRSAREGKECPPRLGVFVVLTGALHTALIGFPGWFTPGDWHGGLPPITLVACAAALAALGFRLTPRRRPAARASGPGPEDGRGPPPSTSASRPGSAAGV